MFGFSFSELVVVVIVALVVMGPKDLPKMLRRLGQWAGKIRRAAADLRAQSGIDDALRSEGLADDIAEIRKLARGEIDAVKRAAEVKLDGARDTSTAAIGSDPSPYSAYDDLHILRDREYPRDCADAYNALPENAIVYADTLPRSALYRDPLYRLGDANAELPPDPPPAEASVDPLAAPEVQPSASSGEPGPGPVEHSVEPEEGAQAAEPISEERTDDRPEERPQSEAP